MNKFTNAKVGLEFHKIISAHSLFANNNYKLISPAHYFLNKVFQTCTIKNCEFAYFHSKFIQNLFHAYTTSYRPIIDALQTLGLLEIKINKEGTETYFHGEDTSKSFTKSYRVTPKCAALLMDDNKEWLRKLHNDPQINRALKKNKAQKLRRLKNTGDLVVDSNLGNLLRLKYSPADAEKVFDSVLMSGKEASKIENQLNNLFCSLAQIAEGDFLVKRHANTGRIYNTWNLMSKHLRPIFNLTDENGESLLNSHVIDLRAAHPCFLALYVKNNLNNKFSKNNIQNTTNSSYYNNNFSNNNSNPNYIHYVTSNEAIEDEVARWNDLWTNPNKDPRERIAADLGITKDHVKKLLNTAINDGKNVNPLHKWIKVNFPNLHSAWTKLGISQTGVNISKQFESELIRDNKFQAFVNNIGGIKILDEHDGISVFSSPDDNSIDSKIERICDYLVQSSFDKFGIKPVIVAKKN